MVCGQSLLAMKGSVHRNAKDTKDNGMRLDLIYVLVAERNQDGPLRNLFSQFEITRVTWSFLHDSYQDFIV